LKFLKFSLLIDGVALTQVVAECTMVARLQNPRMPGSLPMLFSPCLEALVLGVMDVNMQRRLLLLWLLCGVKQNRCRSMVVALLQLEQSRDTPSSEKVSFSSLPQFKKLLSEEFVNLVVEVS
jgi:hypothetical protein